MIEILNSRKGGWYSLIYYKSKVFSPDLGHSRVSENIFMIWGRRLGSKLSWHYKMENGLLMFFLHCHGLLLPKISAFPLLNLFLCVKKDAPGSCLIDWIKISQNCDQIGKQRARELERGIFVLIKRYVMIVAFRIFLCASTATYIICIMLPFNIINENCDTFVLFSLCLSHLLFFSSLSFSSHFYWRICLGCIECDSVHTEL